ncbi:MAG TPA: hypothetical protein VF980_16435 [Thermoanaerobaculia bacterium]
MLPGVATADCPPAVVFDSRRAIRRARLRATIADAAQLILLIGVDWLFLHWPMSHIPSLTRDSSLLIVALLNAALLTHVIVMRTFPRWSAQRIASTWCSAERTRFLAQSRREQAR